MNKNNTYWLISIALTVILILFQYFINPTNPKKVNTTINAVNYTFYLSQSHIGSDPCQITLNIENQNISGALFYREHQSNKDYIEVPMIRNRNELFAHIPNQVKGFKMEYYIELYTLDNSYYLSEKEPVIIQFKDDVSILLKITNNLIIGLALLLALFSTIQIIRKIEISPKFTSLILICLGLSVLLLMPWMQLSSLGEIQLSNFSFIFKAMALLNFSFLLFIKNKQYRVITMITATMFLVISFFISPYL